jgi:hypothetical protein
VRVSYREELEQTGFTLGESHGLRDDSGKKVENSASDLGAYYNWHIE